LVYCRDVVCNHSVTMNVDHLPDDTPLRSLGAHGLHQMLALRRRVPPDWSAHTKHTTQPPKH
jgi:hypothetical protein